MLIDPRWHVSDPETQAKLDAMVKEYGLPCDPTSWKLRYIQGVYETLGNSKHMVHYKTHRFPIVDDMQAYGVCDNYEQVLARYPELQSPDRQFTLCITAELKHYQPARGGWRWEKWGPYIGTQKPKADYLYDEPDIEQVFIYEILEFVQPFEARYPS